MSVAIELDEYKFEDAQNKVKPSEDIKMHSNQTRRIWAFLQEGGWHFYGAVRNWTSIFRDRDSNQYLVIHHFLQDYPDLRLVEQTLCIEWSQIIDRDSAAGQVIQKINHEGYRIMLPVQAFMDAYLQEFRLGYCSANLYSPKHKFQLWGFKENESALLLEFFFEQPFPPYGTKDIFPWPTLREKPEVTQLHLFLEDEYETDYKPAKNNGKGEEFAIEDGVPKEIEEYTDRAIQEIFESFDLVICPFSGGKDSYTLMLKCIKYKLTNPEGSAELQIISADTGIENPLMARHIRSVKQMVESLPIPIPFTIVEPELEDRFFVCIFGKSYAPPSTNFKWCVNRLKIFPGRAALKQYTSQNFRVCQVLGMRDSESITRAKSVEKHYDDSLYGKHVVDGIVTATPIRYWTAINVVSYLVHTSPPWDGYGNYHLLNLYGSAMGGIEECPIGAAISSADDAIKSCSGSASRFGCYLCCVVKEDNSLRNMLSDYPELTPYYEVRSIFKHAQDIRYGGLVGFQRKGKYRFEPGFGDLSIDMRTLLLKRLFENGISIDKEEIYTIYRLVVEREGREGNPITNRFRDALFSFLKDRPLFAGFLFNPLLDPTGTIDRPSSNEREVIDRVLRQLEEEGVQI